MATCLRTHRLTHTQLNHQRLVSDKSAIPVLFSYMLLPRVTSIITWLLSYFDFCPLVPLVYVHHPLTLLRYADKCIVNIMKVYIKRNNLQLESIWYHKHFDFIHIYFCEVTDSMLVCTECIPGSFKHKPLRSLSFLNGNRRFQLFFNSLCRIVIQCLAS